MRDDTPVNYSVADTTLPVVIRQRSTRAPLLFALLLPLTTLLTPLLSHYWSSGTPQSAAALYIPLPVRRHLERALSDTSIPSQRVSLSWDRQINYLHGGHLWICERRDRKGYLRAIGDETTGEVTLFSRESVPETQKAEYAAKDTPIRNSDDARAAASAALRRLSKGPIVSWQLTIKQKREFLGESPYETWCVRGTRDGRSFVLRLDARTGALLFYVESGLPGKAVPGERPT